MAAMTTLRVTVDNAPAQTLITRVREAAAEALAAARHDGQELTTEAAVDTALGAALTAILRVRSAHEDAEAELARLREGEEPTEGHDPAVEHSNGQWLYRFNRAPAAERLQVIDALRVNAARGTTCFLMAHGQRLAEERSAGVPCAGFPDRCPNVRSVPPNPPEHGGGIRCGCGDPEPGLREQVTALRDTLRGVSGEQWLVERLNGILDPPPPVRCGRCRDCGYVPNWQDWDAYHGEPKPKPCPDCQTTEFTP